MEHETSESTRSTSRKPGETFRRNVVAVGAALGLTFAGLGVAGATAPEATGGSIPAAESAEARPHLPGARRGLGRGHRVHGRLMETAAEAIGVTVEALRTELKAGRSIATVAEEHGVDPQQVIDALVAEAESHLRERFTRMVNRTPGERFEDRKAAEEEAAPTAA